MSITPQDVRHLIDHNRDNPGPRQQDVSRIVRVLNAHRRTTTTSPGGNSGVDTNAVVGAERTPD